MVFATAEGAQAGGYYCETCDCVLKDSVSFIDHINGMKHQRKLGFTMRVERKTLAHVKDRFKMHEARLAEKRKRKPLDMAEYEKRQQKRHDEEVAAKKAKLAARRTERYENWVLNTVDCLQVLKLQRKTRERIATGC